MAKRKPAKEVFLKARGEMVTVSGFKTHGEGRTWGWAGCARMEGI